MISYSPQLYNELHMGLTTLYVTATSSTDIEFLKEDFVQTGNSFVTATDSSTIPIGIAIQRTMTLTVLNKSGKFNEFEFKNAVLTVFINGDLTTGETDKIKIGKFTVNKAKANNSIITLSLTDDMIKAEKEFSTNLSFPVTAGDLLADCCNSCGISLGDTEFQNSATTLYKKPERGTFREIIANIALIAGGVAVFDGDNELRIKSPNLDILNEKFYLFEKPYFVGSGWGKTYIWYHQGETFTNYDTLDYYLNSTPTKAGNWKPDVVYNYSGNDILIDSPVVKVHLADMYDTMQPFLTNVSTYHFYGTLSFIIDNQSYSFIIKDQSIYFNATRTTLQNDNKVYPNDMNISNKIIQDVYYRRVYEGAEHIGEFYISFANSFYNKIQDRRIEFLEIKSKVLLSSFAYSFEGSGYEVAGSFTQDETDSYDGGLFTDNANLLNLSDSIKLTYEKEGIRGCRTAITCTGSKFSGTRYYGQMESSPYRSKALPVDISKCLFLETNSDNWVDRATGLAEIDLIGNAIGSIISSTSSSGKPSFLFYPFSADTTMNPFAEICDICYFEDTGNLIRSFVSDIEFTFGGITKFSNDTKSQNETQVSTSSSVISVASSIRNSDRNIQPYETQVEQLNNLANNALPYYITKEISGNSIITYYHNFSSLSSSTIVYKICQEGIFLSHDGGNTWISGIDKDGNIVSYTASIGQLLASKLTVLNDAYIKNHSSPIGTIKSAGSSSLTASLASTTSLTKIADLTTLEPGVWVISARIQFPSNSTGNRGGAIYSNGAQQGTSYILLPAGSSIISQSMSAIVNSTSEMDIDLYVRQNSGSAMTITYYWKAVRIQ